MSTLGSAFLLSCKWTMTNMENSWHMCHLTWDLDYAGHNLLHDSNNTIKIYQSLCQGWGLIDQEGCERLQVRQRTLNERLSLSLWIFLNQVMAVMGFLLQDLWFLKCENAKHFSKVADAYDLSFACWSVRLDKMIQNESSDFQQSHESRPMQYLRSPARWDDQARG